MRLALFHTIVWAAVVALPCLLILPRAAAQSIENLPRRAVLGAAVADEEGLHITFIRPGSSAQRAGLQVGDRIVSAWHHAVSTTGEFVGLVKTLPTGQPVEFEIRRGVEALKLPVILDPAPNEDDALVNTLYQSIDVDGTLRRTLLTVPRGLREPRPGVLILGGIGCYSVDNPSDTQDAYLRLAHDLGQKGFVVLRLEKSGIGDSQGPPCMSVDFASEMRSYEIALESLKRNPRIDRSRIYLLGHSIGTLMAPRIANKEKVAGVIVAEAVGRNWIEYELWNLRRQLELAGEAAPQIDATLASKELCMHRLLIERQGETEIEASHPECKTHNVYPAPASYMQQAAALNVAEPWAEFSFPLLAIYGTADFVTAEDDHRRIVNIVNSKRPDAAKLTLVPGMDHHLEVAGTPQQAYDMRVKQGKSGPYDKGLSAAVLNWLCLREKCEATAGSPK